MAFEPELYEETKGFAPEPFGDEFVPEPFSEESSGQIQSSLSFETAGIDSLTNGEQFAPEPLIEKEPISSLSKMGGAVKAFAHETAGAVAGIPTMEQAKETLFGDTLPDLHMSLLEKTGIEIPEQLKEAYKKTLGLTRASTNPMARFAQTIDTAEQIPVIKNLFDKLDEFSVNQIKTSDKVRRDFSEQSEGFIDLIKQRRGVDAGEKILESAIFETPRLAMQIAMAYFSRGGSLGYMAESAAARKYASLVDEDISPTERIGNALGTGVTEFFSERLGTGRVLDKAFSGKMKSGAFNKVKEVVIDMIGGSVSEGVAQVGENALDQMIGMDASLGDGVAEAMILGSLFDGGTSIAGIANNARSINKIKKGLVASGATEQEADSVLEKSTKAKTKEELNEVDKEIGEILSRNKSDTGSEVGDAVLQARAEDLVSQETRSASEEEELDNILEKVNPTISFEINKQKEVSDADTIERTEAVKDEQKEPAKEGEKVQEGEVRKEEVLDERITKEASDEALIKEGERLGAEFQGRQDDGDGGSFPIFADVKTGKSFGVEGDATVAEAHRAILEAGKPVEAEKPVPGLAPVSAEKVAPEARETQETAPKTVSLVGDEIGIIREGNNLDSLDAPSIQKNIETLNSAKSEGMDKEAEGIAAEVLKTPRVVTPSEHAGMVIRAGQLISKKTKLLESISENIDSGKDVSSDQEALDGLNERLDRLTFAADLSKTEAGRALQIRKMRLWADDFSLASLESRARAAKGSKLSAKEQQNIINLGKQIEEQSLRIKQLEIDISRIEAEKGADEAINKAYKTKKRRKKEDILSERKDIKKQLESLGYRVNDVTGVTIESAILISKLATNYVEGGAQTLKEVTELLHRDIPDLSDKNIWDSIGGRVQRVSKRAKSETQNRIIEIKKQARLSGQIEDGFNKIFDPERKTKPTSKEVSDLQRNLKLLESAYRITEMDETVYAEKVQRIKNLQNQIDGLFRDIKPSKTALSGTVANANKKIKTLLLKIKKIDYIADLKEQIRTGNYKKTTNETSRSPELDDLSDQIKFLKEEIALRTRKAITDGKTDSEQIISLQKSLSEVREQIKKGYRNLPIPKQEISTRVKLVKKELNESVSLRDTLDKISDLQEQIRTGNYRLTSDKLKTVKGKELADAQIKLHQLQRDVRNTIHTLRPRGMRDYLKEVITLPRSMLATMDMSYALRQGLLPSLAHPIIAGDAFGKSFQAFFSQKKADAVDLDIKNHPMKDLFDKFGLHLSNIDSAINNREELFASNLAEKIPGFGKVVMASERNMVTGLNLLRVGLMTDFLNKHPDASDDSKKAYAKYVNIATGRGQAGFLDKSAEELSLIFFAPRFAVSRIQAPYEAIKMAVQHPETRMEMGKQWGALLGTGMTVLTLAAMAGADVVLDPDDSDFGKIVVDNKHIDIWGGIQQPMRILAKSVKAGYKRINGKEVDYDPISDIGNFLKYKLSPPVIMAKELLSGRDIIGRKLQPLEIGDFTIPKEAASVMNNFIPLIVQSGVEAYNEGEDPAVIAALVAGEGLGLSIGVYDKKKKKKFGSKF